MPTTPLSDRLDRPAEPTRRGLSLNRPAATPRPAPEVREPQQVEGPWRWSLGFRFRWLAGPLKRHHASSPASTVLREAPTSQRPSRRASFPSLGGTCGCACVRSVPPDASGTTGSFAIGSPTPTFRRRRWDLPGSWRTPLCLCPGLRPRRDHPPKPCRVPVRPPPATQRRLPRADIFRGSIPRLWHWLSTLRPAGCPDRTQDSLPAVG